MTYAGQYYDPETDLFENWHRYYDANTGRYLEPDLIWRYPEKLEPRLAAGRFDPVYAYAGNNPISSGDPDGREIKYEDSSGNPLTASSSSEDLLLMARGMDALDTVAANTSDTTGVAAGIKDLRDSKTYTAEVIITTGHSMTVGSR